MRKSDFEIYIASITKDDFRTMDEQDRAALLSLHQQINGCAKNLRHYESLMRGLDSGEYIISGLVNPDFELAKRNRQALSRSKF
jgi:hypothetical protein